jgi:hypothetical protein
VWIGKAFLALKMIKFRYKRKEKENSSSCGNISFNGSNPDLSVNHKKPPANKNTKSSTLPKNLLFGGEKNDYDYQSCVNAIVVSVNA